MQRPHSNYLEHNQLGRGALMDRLAIDQSPAGAALLFSRHEAGLPTNAAPTTTSKSRQHEQANWLHDLNLPASSSCSRLQFERPGVPIDTEVHRFSPSLELPSWHEEHPQLMNASHLPVPRISRLLPAEETNPLVEEQQLQQLLVQLSQTLAEEVFAEEQQPLTEEASAREIQPLAEEIQRLPLHAREEAAGIQEEIQIDRDAIILFPEPPSPPPGGSSNDSQLVSTSATAESGSLQLEARINSVSGNSEEDTSFTLGGHLKSTASEESMEARDGNGKQSNEDVSPRSKKTSQQEQLRGPLQKNPSQLQREFKIGKAQDPKIQATRKVKGVTEPDGMAKRQAMLEAAEDLQKNKRQNKPMRWDFWHE